MLITRTLAMWQADALTGHDLHLLMIFGGVIAGALLLQSLVVLFAGLAGMKVQQGVKQDIAEFKAKALPMMDKVNALTAQVSTLATELTPTLKNVAAKVDIIAGHAEHISALAREKAEEFAPTISAANETVAEANETVREANRATQEQIARVNDMVSDLLDATVEAGNRIKRGINIPVQNAAGLLSGLKAAVDVLRRPKPKPFVGHIEYHQPYHALQTGHREYPDVLDEGIPGEPPEQ
jgi:ABC-type transporter Mla subunit MlaD